MNIRGVDFLFSGWSRDGHDKQLRALCQDCSNIHFHLGVKSRAQLNYIVAKADIGLAIYDPKDENVRNIGLSSGKIFKYLAFGKPVILNEMQYLSDYIRERNLGVSVSTGEIDKGINTIFDNYMGYQSSISIYNLSNAGYKSCYSKLINDCMES
jgi:glycosyltransferase involved in cell wall biosynthesis